MKKIYSLTLDDDVPLSENTGSDIRAVAFWLFDELANFDKQIICFDGEKETNDQGLIRNELFDIKCQDKYMYRFTSDCSKIDSRMFEPFILSDRAFAFTVNEGTITDGEIVVILEKILGLLKLNYKFNIDSIFYDDKNIKNRYAAIEKLLNSKNEVQVKTKKRTKLQLNPVLTMFSIW